MTELTPAISAAVEAGKRVATSGRYEPVAVDHNGRLTARVLDTNTEEVEGVYIQGSQLIFTQLGRAADGTVKCHTVRAKELKRIVRAMITDPSDDLLREAFRARRERTNGNGKARRIRRKG